MEMTNYASLLTWARPELVNSENYERLASKLEKLMALAGSSPAAQAGKMIDLLAKLLGDYEAETFEQPHVSGREILAHILESRGDSRVDFARAMDISPQVLSNVLNGQRTISKKLALQLAEKLSMDAGPFLAPDTLLGRILALVDGRGHYTSKEIASMVNVSEYDVARAVEPMKASGELVVVAKHSDGSFTYERQRAG